MHQMMNGRNGTGHCVLNAHGRELVARKLAEIKSRKTGEQWVASRENAASEDDVLDALPSGRSPAATLTA